MQFVCHRLRPENIIQRQNHNHGAVAPLEIRYVAGQFHPGDRSYPGMVPGHELSRQPIKSGAGLASCLPDRGNEGRAILDAPELFTGNVRDRIIEPKDGELARMVRDLRRHHHDIFINVNNHYEDSTPKTIDKTEDLLSAPIL